MNLLAFDTSSKACTVGLRCGDSIRTVYRNTERQHAIYLLPIIDELLSLAELSVAQLDAIIFGQGPGSFTGLRVAVATAQGLALGADLGVIGVSTLQCMAQGCWREYQASRVAVCVDARMSEVYFAGFESCNGLMQAVTEEMVCPPEAVPRWQGRWVGSGVDRYPAVLACRTDQPEQSLTVMQADALPHAADLLVLGEYGYEQGQMVDAADAAPVYLRNKVALTCVEQAVQRKQT